MQCWTTQLSSGSCRPRRTEATRTKVKVLFAASPLPSSGRDWGLQCEPSAWRPTGRISHHCCFSIDSLTSAPAPGSSVCFDCKQQLSALEALLSALRRWDQRRAAAISLDNKQSCHEGGGKSQNTHKWPCHFRADTWAHSASCLNSQFLSSFASPFTERNWQVTQRLYLKKGNVQLKPSLLTCAKTF